MRGRMRRGISLVLVTALAVGALACGGPSTGTSGLSSSTSPSTGGTTQTFTGTVPIGGGDNHPFTVANPGGVVTIVLTETAPQTTVIMGFGVGTPAGTTCAYLSTFTKDTSAGAASQLKGSLNPGTYCVGVYDIGNATSAITYTVTVTHP